MNESILRYHNAGEIIHPDSPDVYKPTPEDLEFTLKSERVAWAFTLKKIKPFLKDLGISEEDLRVYLHNEMLAAYSDSIRKLIEKGLIDEIK